MSEIPKIIGGARTLFYTLIDHRHLATGNTKHIVSGQLVTKISGLAICKYANDHGFYLFGCDENWNSITETYHDSIEEAKDQAAFEYINSVETWIEMKNG
jgi:hypothetical protein